MASLQIGELAELAGVTTPTVRYYESIGLLKKPPRSASGYRHYSEATIRELGFIRKARALGFSLNDITEIVKLTRSGKRPCARVIDLAKEHLAEVDEQMQKLATFREQLAAEVARWERPRDPVCDGLCEMIESANPAPGSQPPVTRLNNRTARKHS